MKGNVLFMIQARCGCGAGFAASGKDRGELTKVYEKWAKAHTGHVLDVRKARVVLKPITQPAPVSRMASFMARFRKPKG